MNWTHTQTLQFINVIKERPALWDKSSIEYKSKNKRPEVWEEMAQLMDVSARDAEAKWTNLITQYYREKRRCRERGPNAQSKWFAYNVMDNFLSRNIRSRTRKKLWRKRDTPRPGWSSSGIQHQPGRTDPLNDVLKEAINTLTVIRQNKIDNTPTYPSDDALKSFGEYITVTLRKFSPQIQSKAKYEIHQILYKADMENLGRRIDASSLQEDINENEDMNEAEYINENEDMNEAEYINEAEDMNEAEYLIESGDTNEAEYLNEAEDTNEAKYLNESEDMHEAEYLNESEDMHEAEYLNESEDMHKAEYLNEAEDTNEAEYLIESEDMNEAEYLNESEDMKEAEYLNEAEDTNEAEYLNEAEDTNNSEDLNGDSENKNKIEIVFCGEDNNESS